MKDKTSIFASDISLDDNKSNDKSDDDDDGDDDDDYDELNRLKQRYKDKEKNNVTHEQNDRNASYGHADNDDVQEKYLFYSDLGQEFNVTASISMDCRDQQHQ